MALEKVVACELYWPGKLARARLKFDLDTSRVVFYTSICEDFWVPMHQSNSLTSPVFIQNLDNIVGENNRLTMYAMLKVELKRVEAAHRAFLALHMRPPPPV
ncbi:hypothetical protein LXA47_31280 [Massilia sp. P8910]|uniref:hypothetical protein n=1 Tax=Massilia antarctica TaxID=2765360 RepID=UPI001E5B70C2|nr:hypothetical protein [Massilia antarctica]MCE3608054.1 hypothetical protein [Massilia antarctica]